MKYYRISVAFALVLGLFGIGLPMPAQAQAPDERCFPETGFCIGGRIREYWEQNGGLNVFGFPTGPQQQERVEASMFQVQHFQRHRLELHPENQAPYDVLLGRLGAEQVQHMRVASLPEEPLAGCLRFEQTQHMVCAEFAEAWQRDGLEFDGQPGKSFGESLALFGLPITGRMRMTLEDGQRRDVQYFERARFEYHPENAAPFNVLFGLLDNEARAGTTPPRPQSLLPAPLYFLYENQIIRLERDGLTQVSVIDERGSGEISTFNVSGDGTTLAYVLNDGSGYKLIRADGAGANRLELFSYPEPIGPPRWSPDGTRIAVHAGELAQDAQGALYLVPTNGGQPRMSLPDSKTSPRLAYLPESWSADGQRIAVSAVVKQSEGCVPMLYDPAFGSEVLSDPPALDGQRVACGGAWATQGRVRYLSIVPEGGPFANAGLWRADLLANQVKPLVPVQTVFGYNLFGGIRPRADGATSVFLTKSRRLPQLGDTQPILYAPYIIGPDGTEIRQVGTTAFALRDVLGWAPDGSGFLLYGTLGDPIGRVKTIWVPLDGGAPYEIDNASFAVAWGR